MTHVFPSSPPPEKDDPVDFDRILADHGEPDAAEPPLSTKERLELRLLGARRLTVGNSPQDRRLAWVGGLLLVVVAAVTRLWNLGHPGKLVFDETYYVKNAYTLLREGYETSWPQEPNASFESGNVDIYLPTADYVVHPPLGKWMIAMGMKAFGGAENPWSWRISSAIIGIAAVVLIFLAARLLFSSTAMGLIAGGLFAIDGEAIVHSRIALLDNFLMFFVLLGFYFILRDRDQARRRLAARCAEILDRDGALGNYGPWLGWRWWRFAAAIALGLSCGVKWSGIYFLAVFAVLSVLWDLSARRSVGIRRWWEDGFLVDGLPAALIMVPTAVLSYLAAWSSWFISSKSYFRHWASENPGGGVTWLPESLRSWWEYHYQMWHFHQQLSSPHSYAAHPLGWIVQWRPTSFYWDNQLEDSGCAPRECVEAITSIGNPLVWWFGAAAIGVTLFWLVKRRDWRAMAALSGIVAGWLPWLMHTDRTIFTFYSIVFTPWVVLTLTYVITVAFELTEFKYHARRRVQIATGVVIGLIVAVSIFFYPLWSASLVSYDYWSMHMWLKSWV